MPAETEVRPIRPLVDVWLRPRRVFRELSATPVGPMDYWLGSAQGMVGFLAMCQSQSLGLTQSVGEIVGKAALAGPLGGVLGIFLMTAVYQRLGRAAGSANRSQVVHVLAYGGMPVVASLGLWLVAALLAGKAAFIKELPADLEPFLGLILRGQSAAYLVLVCWSLLLQVMGYSEVAGISMAKACGIMILGTLAVLVAMLVLMVVVAMILYLGFGMELPMPPG